MAQEYHIAILDQDWVIQPTPYELAGLTEAVADAMRRFGIKDVRVFREIPVTARQVIEVEIGDTPIGPVTEIAEAPKVADPQPLPEPPKQEGEGAADPFLTVPQAAQERGCSENAIRFAMKNGRLTVETLAGRQVIPRRSFEEYQALHPLSLKYQERGKANRLNRENA